jgi:Tfp pilus assembly protein PilF
MANNKPFMEIIAIQADIALQIADNIKAYITDSERQNIQNIPTTNQEAYELIQQGYNLWRTRRFNTLDTLIELGRKAIELDPNYADAYAWLGNMTLAEGTFWGGSEMQSVEWAAESYLDKALELDQNNIRALYGMALHNELIKWDYIKAEEEFLKSIKLSPYNPSIIESYSEFLAKRNRLEDALASLKNAEARIDLQTEVKVISSVLSGNKSEAINSINIFLNSQAPFVNCWAGWYYILMEDFNSAKQSIETAIKNNENYILKPRFQACLALAYHKTKDYQKAQVIINKLIDKSKQTSGGSPEYYAGWYYSGIGKVDSAFYWIEEAFKKRSPEMPWLKVDPVFKNLKNDKRYWDLYERTGHKA